ncbi:MAG: RimK family alpha-L-glutamate ligase, partial [Clostridia bacterium]|nr:RimK family alpha-L-glutamate ligase [Clostridia bacterium]
YVDNDCQLKSKISDYDCCIYLDKDKYMSLMFEKRGLRLFNSHEAIQACDDKMITAILLANNGVPMPKTLAGLLCYNLEEPVKSDSLDIVESRLGYPLIVKTCYGSLGKGVFKVDGREELEKIAEQVKGVPHLFQEYISSSRGKDIRVIVIGGKAVVGMLRKSQGDFRSNIELGGVGEKIELTDDVVKLTQNVAKILKLDYCGVDVLIGEDGYYICEVNSNAFFGGIESVTDFNVAKSYAEYICETMRL